LVLISLSLLLSGCLGAFGFGRYTVSGRITTREGSPIPGVTVSSDGRVRRTAVTDENGIYRLQRLRGRNLITAAKIGWAFEGSRTVSGRKRVDFVGEERWVSLTIAVEGGGEVVLRPLDGGEYSGGWYPYGLAVELTAVPAEDHAFSRWEGAVESRANPLTVVLVEDMSVTAVFGKFASISGTIEVQHVFSGPGAPGPGLIAVLPSLRRGPREAALQRAWQREEPEEPEEWIVGTEPGTDPEAAERMLEELGWEVLRRLAVDAYVVRPKLGAALHLFTAERSDYPISYVEPNHVVYALGEVRPDDPRYPEQWNYELIRLPQAWSTTTGSAAVRIAVLDTGVDASHPDLAGHLDTEYARSFASSPGSPSYAPHDFTDRHGHGTHVAGIIGALTNNGEGIAGVMWDVEILPVKVLGDGGKGSIDRVAEGLLYAVGAHPDIPNPRPAQVVNMSLGSASGSETLKRAVEKAFQQGALLVAAAGNADNPWHRRGIYYPAAYPGVIAVGAVDYNYGSVPKVASYSRYGPEMGFVAPGGEQDVDSDGNGKTDAVLSTHVLSPYEYLLGTSMAAPHVSGVIGLMLTNGIPAGDVVDVLRRTSIPLGREEFSEEYGWGLINAYWAVNDVREIKVLVGTREGNTITAVAEASIGLKGGSFHLEEVPVGEYQVFAWLDVVQDGGGIEPGDYFAESPPFSLEARRSYTVSGFIAEVRELSGFGMQSLTVE